MNDILASDEIEEAIAWRHELHKHPELAFAEHWTADFIARQLASWGYAVRTGLAGTGVVGTLSRGQSGKVIGIRADIDALPIEEETGVAHASRIPGTMHACGHDGHVAMALAAARRLAATPLDGTAHFVFQPAEENEGGAHVMVEQGLFREFPMQAVYALHNWPGLPVGHVVARPDAMMAAFATFEITVKGQGSHGAMPHQGADPVVAAGQLVVALQTVASRNLDPLAAGVVSVTQIHGGDTWNVIPERVVLRGTTRWFETAAGQRIEERIASVARSVCEAMGCEAEVRYQHRYPATVNEPAAAATVRSVAATVPGIQVADALPSMAAEDFAFMLDEAAGSYFWLGAAREGGANPGLHSPRFDFNDGILGLGASMWVSLVRHELRAS